LLASCVNSTGGRVRKSAGSPVSNKIPICAICVICG